MGLVYKFNPLGGPVKLSTNEESPILPIPANIDPFEPANIISTTASWEYVQQIDTIYYGMGYGVDSVAQEEILSLWAEEDGPGWLWTGLCERSVRTDPSDPVKEYTAPSTTPVWGQTGWKTSFQPIGLNQYASQYFGFLDSEDRAGFNPPRQYAVMPLGFNYSLWTYIQYWKSAETPTELEFSIIIPFVYTESGTYDASSPRYCVAGYFKGSVANDIGDYSDTSLANSSSKMWLNIVPNLSTDTSYRFFNKPVNKSYNLASPEVIFLRHKIDAFEYPTT